MKLTVLMYLILFCGNFIFSQQMYIDFDTTQQAKLYYKSGRIDIKAGNPKPCEVNASSRCAKYNRTSSLPYDNIKFALSKKLENVMKYASYEANAPKIKMKVFTGAAPGTVVEIQLAKLSELEYPLSVHSHYRAVTQKQNEWEELVFTYSHSPKGSIVKANEINMIYILFAPETKSSDKFYFDDISGPAFAGSNITSHGKKK
jgi:hypothetical protein